VKIFIFRNPAEILRALSNDYLDPKTCMRVAWVIDSFWVEKIPKFTLGIFDLVIISRENDRDYYERAGAKCVLVFPWGSDVLRLEPPKSKDRKFDLLRLGRQPKPWDNDEIVSDILSAAGLHYHGRPSMDIPYLSLAKKFQETKFVLAFSNFFDSSKYTHPTQEYYTARWTDSLACGAVIAGIPPNTDTAMQALLWEEALLSLPSTGINESVPLLTQEVSTWSPKAAMLNYSNSLRRLDWRHRIKTLCDQIGFKSPTLDEELKYLQKRANDLERHL